MRQQSEEKSIANALMAAKIQELQRKTQALGEAPPEGYFRDAYSGKLHKTLPSVGGDGNLNQNLTATKFDAYGRPKEYVDYNNKALSGDASRQWSGAMQGLENIQSIEDTLGLTQGPEGIAPDYQAKILGRKMAGFRGNPVMQGPAGILPALMRNLAGEDARNLDTQYETLKENELRSRTGAAANPFEYWSVSNRIEPSLTDRPANIANKLNLSKKYLGRNAEAVRPGSTRDMKPNLGQQPTSEMTATGPNGAKLVLRNGQWQPQ